MGRMSTEPLQIETIDDLVDYLRGAHSAYVQYGAQTYYLTDANDIYWRAQNTNELNEKGHFVDCSELVPVLSEFIDLPFYESSTGKKSLRDMFDRCTFYASRKVEGQGTPVPII